MVQTVSNLLHNAIKFTDPGGRVWLSVGAQEPGWAQVAVKDSGAGIPAELLTSIFEPFIQRGETIGRTRSGLGLGLALAKGLAELHGGTLSARSDGPGMGAEFTLRLPLAGAGGLTEPQALAVSSMARARGRRVLIVEDGLDAAATLKLLLEFWGHTVAVAHEGRSGLVEAERFRPEIILCDIGLPGGLDGYAVAREIRKHPGLAKVHLVAMTGFGSAGAKDLARQAGFELQLTKPVEPDLLELLIANLQD
jgi:CheY-like chemotaxis protein